MHKIYTKIDLIIQNYYRMYHKNLSRGAGLFGVLTLFALYSLTVYCTACFSFLKVGPVLEMNRSLSNHNSWTDLPQIILIRDFWKATGMSLVRF